MSVFCLVVAVGVILMIFYSYGGASSDFVINEKDKDVSF